MALSTAQKIIDFIFEISPRSEKISIGFFGGEPLLEFGLIEEITTIIRSHNSFQPNRVEIAIATNGTIFSQNMANFLIDNNITLNVSCDGPAIVHDAFRHFPDGSGCSNIVENNIRQLLKIFPFTPVNAVYSPENLQSLPDVVDYLSSLGVKNIHLNHNISANWTKHEADMLPRIYNAIGKNYMDCYQRREPKYIDIIDSKIALILRGGYKPLERCRMGTGEFAFAPSGNVYPCEMLIGADEGKEHCLGNISESFIPGKTCNVISSGATNKECMTCGLNQYCMNWCGCANYHSTGSYNIVSPFICALEKAAINTAFDIIQKIDDIGLNFSHHIAGTPLMNVIGTSMKEWKALDQK
jgi:uncharacterized protein